MPGPAVGLVRTSRLVRPHRGTFLVRSATRRRGRVPRCASARARRARRRSVRVGAPPRGDASPRMRPSLRAADGTRADQSVGRHRRPRRSRDGRARGERGRGAHARSGPRRTRVGGRGRAGSDGSRRRDGGELRNVRDVRRGDAPRAQDGGSSRRARGFDARRTRSRVPRRARASVLDARVSRARARARRSARIWAPPETG